MKIWGGLPWAKLEREATDKEIRESVVGRLLREDPHLLSGGWKVYQIEQKGASIQKIFANPRRLILIIFDAERNPSPDQFRKTTTTLNDLQLTFDPPLGRVMGEWEIWSTDDSYIKKKTVTVDKEQNK